MQINKLLTPYNFYNTNNPKKNKYIVIHYTGNPTGDAKAHCEYYASGPLNASAHYFVGYKGDVWQSVEDEDSAWHCGAKIYKHLFCRNTNSIGVEMCCRIAKDGTWYFEEATVNSTIELVKELMKKYNIPIENVIRHYDVTGKICPEPYVRNKAAWQAFKDRLAGPKVPFLVRVLVDDLNYRSKPEMGNNINGQTGKGVFTIVQVSADGEWGKLKSGAGWIYIANPAYIQKL